MGSVDVVAVEDVMVVVEEDDEGEEVVMEVGVVEEDGETTNILHLCSRSLKLTNYYCIASFEILHLHYCLS